MSSVAAAHEAAYARAMPDSLLRHVAASRNAVLPGGRLPFRLGPNRVGWLTPDLAERVVAGGARRDGAAVVLDDPAALPRLARRLADAGALRWRDEAFDVRATPDGPALAQLDRGAVPCFGVLSQGAHLNGLVRRAGETWLWVSRRAADRLMDPGKLDHLAAGGVTAGHTPDETLRKEAGEEAGLPAELLRDARRAATLAYVTERPEGLRRDVLHCYDVDLPESFTPRAVDGETESFELWPLRQVLDRVRRTDDFKFNVNLVLIDLLLREGLVNPAGPEGGRLRAALNAPVSEA